MESKSGNEFKTKNIKNTLCCNNITDIRNLRKGRNKTSADVFQVDWICQRNRWL